LFDADLTDRLAQPSELVGALLHGPWDTESDNQAERFMVEKSLHTPLKNLWTTILRPPPVSREYRQWRDRLIRQRFWLAVGLATAFILIQGVAVYHDMFLRPEALLKNLEQRQLGDLITPLRQMFIQSRIAIVVLLGLVIWFRNSAWGLKYPQLLILMFPWAVSFVPTMIFGAIFKIPNAPDIIMYLAQAAIAPIYWRLHLVAQLVPIAFYFLIYPLLGVTTFAGQSIYSFSSGVEVILICIICEVGVYLYEQSKQAEIEADRRLKLCIHSITHDLRTPVMGSLMLLRSIQQSTPDDRAIEVTPAVMAQLIQGGDRLLGLMNTLLDNQVLARSELLLHRQPVLLSTLVSTVLQDFQPTLLKKKIQVQDRISEDLPALDIDGQQVWRVLCNLISNAINHNPPGLLLELDAEVMDRLHLKVTVQDNGVGIPASQQTTMFEAYTRSAQAQYQPGLGLGLYICRQIVEAHGGEIGLGAIDRGVKIWFTLPLSRD
jgi:signal transduction histidine kinase